MTSPLSSRPVVLVSLGAAATVVFSALVIAHRGSDHLAFGLVLSVASLGLAAWCRSRRSAPAFGVTLVFGLLHSLEQGMYVASDDSALVLATDLIGLLGGLALLAGAALGLRSRRVPIGV